MIEILEKVSDQVKKVDNMQSRSVPVLEGEYYTTVVSQTKITTHSKLSAPPNLPTFLGQEPVPSTEGSGRGHFGNPDRGSSQISSNRIS